MILSNFLVPVLAINQQFIYIFKPQHKSLFLADMENESEPIIEPVYFNNSEWNSDILSVKVFPNLQGSENKKIEEEETFRQYIVQNEQQISDEETQKHFNALFSTKVCIESLVRRNQFLEMKVLQISQSDHEHIPIYKRRKSKVANLAEKDKKNKSLLEQIKITDEEKYKKLQRFLKFLSFVKSNINGVRHDYYSQKTFQTLNRSSEKELEELTKALVVMYNNVKSKSTSTYEKIAKKEDRYTIDEKEVDFLILPRFLISKEKMIKFLHDQEMQQRFQFLIFHGCLGHYNNEANKKMPEHDHMKLVRQLICSVNGKEKYKKISSINHGGKFSKRFPDLYNNLFFKTLSCLQNIQKITKSKKDWTISDVQQQIFKQSKPNPSNQSQNSIGFSFTQYQNLSCLQQNDLERSEIEKPLLIKIQDNVPLIFSPNQYNFSEEYDLKSFFGSSKRLNGSEIFKNLQMDKKNTSAPHPKNNLATDQIFQRMKIKTNKVRRFNSLDSELILKSTQGDQLKISLEEDEMEVRTFSKLKKRYTLQNQRGNIIIVHPPIVEDQLI